MVNTVVRHDACDNTSARSVSQVMSFSIYLFHEAFPDQTKSFSDIFLPQTALTSLHSEYI